MAQSPKWECLSVGCKRRLLVTNAPDKSVRKVINRWWMAGGHLNTMMLKSIIREINRLGFNGGESMTEEPKNGAVKTQAILGNHKTFFNDNQSKSLLPGTHPFAECKKKILSL